MSIAEIIKHLQRPRDYCAEREQIFEGEHSFRWFVRRHKDDLVKAGALMRPAGSWLVQPAAFDQVVSEVGQKRAAGR